MIKLWIPERETERQAWKTPPGPASRWGYCVSERKASWEEQVWPHELSSSHLGEWRLRPLPFSRPRPQSRSSAREGRVTLEENSQRVGEGDLGLGQGQLAGVSSCPGAVSLSSWHWTGQAVSEVEASGKQRRHSPQHTGTGRVALTGCGVWSRAHVGTAL